MMTKKEKKTRKRMGEKKTCRRRKIGERHR
jgi:hypothetical protein